MRKKLLSVLALSMVMTGCADGNKDNKDTSVAESAAETSTTAEATEATTKESEPETKATEIVTEEETTTKEEETVWETTAPEVIRGAASAEEIFAGEKEIMEKGTFLYSGAENEGYYPDDAKWFNALSPEDVIAIAFTCDDVTHGGWGVLGLTVNGKQNDIPAFGEEPDRERIITFTVAELCKQAGVEAAADINEFMLGAWNGGHIQGLYVLEGDVAKELTDYMTKAEEDTAIIHSYDGSLSNPNAIPEAVAVYDYLKDVWNAQDSCLTGQMESTWKGSADYEMNYIQDISGKLPAIRGLDFMHNDFDGVTRRSKEWWEKGGIPTICWHTGSSFDSAYNECKADNLDWDKVFDPTTDEYKKLIADMDRAVPYLQMLEDDGVPVLWRPFHELDGGWFWWSKGGSENFVKLWQLMYSRYTDFWGLDNLIWVFGYSHNGVEMANWYPGDNYVDLIGGDSYNVGANHDLYEDVQEVAADGMPIVFHECGTIPSEADMDKEDTRWLFFMVWHTDYITDSKNNTKDHINEIYNSDYFITLDELPSFK